MQNEMAEPQKTQPGYYSTILLYIAFFMIPGMWLSALHLDKSVPEGVASMGAFFGVTFISYGLYKIASYGLRKGLIGPTLSPWVASAFRVINELR